MRSDISIRPETHKDYKEIVDLVLRSFKEGTNYSGGTDVVALIEEIRDSVCYIPELSFVAELDSKIVGYFMFSYFPISRTTQGGYTDPEKSDILMLSPVAVHADYLKEGIGTAMLTLGLAEAKKYNVKGITVEGNYLFYNHLGFRTSSEYGIYPTSGYPMKEPRCMMCQECYEGSLKDVAGYIVYDMYYNA